MDTCFDRVWACNRPTIMRRRMEVFTLGHAAVLWSMRSPCVSAVPDLPTVGDCIASGYICSVPWRDALKAAQCPGRVTRQCEQWGEACSRDDLQAGAAAVLRYIRESCETPTPIKRKDASPHDPGVPWPWQVAWSQKVLPPLVWDVPCVEALAWYACRAAENGAEFLTEQILADAAAVVVTKDPEAAQ